MCCYVSVYPVGGESEGRNPTSSTWEHGWLCALVAEGCASPVWHCLPRLPEHIIMRLLVRSGGPCRMLCRRSANNTPRSSSHCLGIDEAMNRDCSSCRGSVSWIVVRWLTVEGIITAQETATSRRTLPAPARPTPLTRRRPAAEECW